MHNEQQVGILAIQLAVAGASPSAWRDAIVVATQPGVLELMTLDGDTVHVATGALAAVGEPVAVHAVAELLAAGRARFTARPIS